jgi:predicted flap endonuclease-1-like 5' DNA nuclease
MSAFSCCIWWFLIGVVAGFLLNWLLQKSLRNGGNGTGGIQQVVMPAVTAAPLMPGSIDTGAAALAGFSVKGDDDLPIIEGIGPKISELLKSQGVTTFARLANTSIADITSILENGGARFKLANPGSWPTQARLCAENRWSELKRLQDELYAGVAASDAVDTHKA